MAQYGSVENLIANAHELKGKQKEKVEQFADQAMLSKKLATIITDVPIEFDERSLTLDPPDEENLKAIFAELEFRTMAKRIFGDGGPAIAEHA